MGNATEAAARAGYGGNRASLAVQGCRLVKKLRFAKECSEKGLSRSQEDIKETISDHLWAVSTARPEKITATHKLKAMELYARLNGLFDPPEQTNLQMNYFDVKSANPQELQARLQELQRLQQQASAEAFPSTFSQENLETQESEQPCHDQGVHEDEQNNF